MATTKEIKNRIKSVKDTQKITNAMYLISSTKMTKAKRELDNTRPYFEMLKKQIVTMIQMKETAGNYYFKEEAALEGESPDTPKKSSDGSRIRRTGFKNVAYRSICMVSFTGTDYF